MGGQAVAVGDTSSSYDLRQLKRMESSLRSFRESRLSLMELIENLEALNSSIELKETTWEREFEENWATLEETYAFMLSEERTSLNERESALIRKAVSALSELVAQEFRRREEDL
jgi:hypothetical protein